MEQEILSVQHDRLVQILQDSFEESEIHSQAFALRVLYPKYVHEITQRSQLCCQPTYGGYPQVAALGFLSGRDCTLSPNHESYFLEGLTRLKSRTGKGIQSLCTDDVALLGIAEGLAHIARKNSEDHDIQTVIQWLVEIIDTPANMKLWSSRMRDLAGDLLDRRGQLRVALHNDDIHVNALETTLRSIWRDQFSHVTIPSREEQRRLLKQLLTRSLPHVYEIEKIAVWLKTLDVLVDYTCEVLFPSLSDVASILKNTQHSFKRWVWDEKATRKNTSPAMWLIDKEAHIQSLLWAILYPIYQSELVDETYLPSWGNVQPRFDLGIVKLKLIIEVKYARQASDFKAIEEQVAGDLGLYFKDTDMFDSMIVYIYDDCDTYHPEQHGSLRNALMERERIEDVIIVRRPGMIPNRNERKFS